MLEDKASAQDLETLEPLAQDLLEQDDAQSLVSLLLNLYLNPPEADPADMPAPSPINRRNRCRPNQKRKNRPARDGGRGRPRRPRNRRR